MSREAHLAIMRDPQRWPFRAVLCLAHVTERGAGGIALCGVLAVGHGATVFVTNVDVFEGVQRRAEFEAKLAELPSRKFETYEELWLAGWRVD